MVNVPTSDLLSRVAGSLRGAFGAGPILRAPPAPNASEDVILALAAQAPHMRCSSLDAKEAAERAVADPARWMRVIADTACAHLREKRLVDIAIVGSHNAGSWCLDEETAASTTPQRAAPGSTCPSRMPTVSCARWSRTQVGNLGAQLRAGSRYLDLRVMYDNALPECAVDSTVDRSCWRTWNNLVGIRADRELARIRSFLDNDRVAAGSTEIVILDLRIEHFAVPNFANTDQRLRVLLGMVTELLDEFAYDGGEWWLDPIDTIVASGRRLIILLDPVVPTACSSFVGSCYTRSRFADLMTQEYGQGSTDPSAIRRMKTKCTRHPTSTTDNRIDPPCEGPIWAASSTTLLSQACCEEQDMISVQRQYQSLYNGQFINGAPYEAYTGDNTGARRPLLQIYFTMAKQWNWFRDPTEVLHTSGGTPVHSALDSAARLNWMFLEFFDNSSQQEPFVAIFGNILMADGLASSNASEPGSRLLLEVAARFSAGGPATDTYDSVPTVVVTTIGPAPTQDKETLGLGFWMLAVATAVAVGMLVSFFTFGFWCKCACLGHNAGGESDQREDGDAFGSFFKIFKFTPGQKKEKKNRLERQSARKSMSEAPQDASMTAKQAKKQRKTLMKAATLEMTHLPSDKPEKEKKKDKDKRKSRATVARAATAGSILQTNSPPNDRSSMSETKRLTTIKSHAGSEWSTDAMTYVMPSTPSGPSQDTLNSGTLRPSTDQGAVNSPGIPRASRSLRRLASGLAGSQGAPPPPPLPGGQRRTVTMGGVSTISIAD